MSTVVGHRSPIGWELLAIALPALVFVAPGLREPIGGSHVFRQSHVASNIEKFVERGPSLRPATHNDDVPFSAFDFPLYQLAVASACRALHSPPLLSARVASLLVYVLSLVAAHRLLVRAGARRWHRLTALALFAWSPLVLFYAQAPMVDGLAVLLSLLALLQYARSQQDEAPGRARATMLAAGFLSALIKSPVFLPACVAVVWHRFRSAGPRRFARSDATALVVAAALGVAAFRLYWMAANRTWALITPWEERQYFGPAAERLSLSAWRPILRDLLLFCSRPVALILAGFGLLHAGRRRRRGLAPLFTGLLLGCAVTLLVFFDRFPPHNYYQLPFVFPIAFFAGEGLELGLALARGGRPLHPTLRLAAAAGPLALAAFAAWGAYGYHALAVSSEADRLSRLRGEWVRAHTEPTDYVLYLFGGTEDDWNPARLYFAGRDGRNVPLRDAVPDHLEAFRAAAAEKGYPRVVAFTFGEAGTRALQSTGATLLATAGRRRLFLVRPLAP